jgi:cold-inducible RNA-binding protein
LLSTQPNPSFDPFRVTNRVSASFVEAEASSIHMSRKLYVGNLPYTTGEQDLESLFAAAGTVESVSVMRDMATGRARGFAFVEMATEDEAQNAISQFNNYSLGGRNLTVNEARPKPQSSGGYGGGGGGGGRGGRREPRW